MGRPRGREGRADGAGSLPETIATLSRVLPAGPSPETFRRAKFDRPEAAPALWRLLADVLSPSPAPGASLPLEAQVRLAKAALRSQGYPRRALALLPEDGSQGSRELLLALAWLLAHGPLLEQLLERSRLRLGDELCVCQCEDPASPGLPTPCVDADGRVDIRQLQWLMGKLRFRWRSLFSMQQEQCALLAKIHSYTRGCHGDRILGHLSVVETELLRNPRHGQQLLRSLEQENVRLEAAVAWRRHQLVFWQWADTVLRTCPPDSPRPRIPTQGTGELELLSQELRALHEELQDVAESRRAAWEARAGALGPEWTVWHRVSQEAVRQELAVLRQAWEQDGAPIPPCGPYRLVKREAAGSEGRGLRAAQVMEALRSREACLEAVLHQLQGQCRQELARLAGAQPGLLWILPPRR
ncbi:tubulin epsilon and delta complex protein 1 isoform X2 [Sorex araneus]|uniref:tubulin epsilon and delta complex protein 1 isoform X2 n=1 Tax=Sorex araneus TaxID=42254 RepID=UPI0024333F9D|nr:tubulin epsilon and delta complex protein 1 isoform X2 [Sorex araneus]